MKPILLPRALLMVAWVMAVINGCPTVVLGQDVLAADVSEARRGLGGLGQDSVARQPPVLVLLEKYDALRLAQVAVLRVGKPALSDTLATAGTRQATGYRRAPALAADSNHFDLNDEVILYVRDLRLALRRSKRSGNDLRLYIGNIVLPMEPRQVDTTYRRNIALVRFRLVRNAETESTWQIFYHVFGKYDHSALFNLGFKEGQLGKAYPSPITVLLVHYNFLYMGLVVLAVLVGACIWLTMRSNFIRSDISSLIPLGAAKQPLGISLEYRRVPFSLAKSQVAFWTLLTIGGYLMITLVTTALPVIPSGLLGLLAVSVGNGVFSQLINRPQPDALNAPVRVANNIGESQGWWYDVLNDASGVSLPRLQFLAFNAIAGGYMVYFVITHWSLPDFDSNILALISISAAGFLANKNIENTAINNASSGIGRTGSVYPNAPLGGGGGNAGTDSNGPSGGTTPGTTDEAGATDTAAANTAPVEAGAGDTTPSSQSENNLLASAVQSEREASGPATAADFSNAASQEWKRKLKLFLKAPVRFDTDPNGELFGNVPSSTDGYRLDVRILSTLRGGLDLIATVTCDLVAAPSGDVVFLLHPTYEQRVVPVSMRNGEASVRFFSAGCFTVVAMLNTGQLVLAFDLRNVSGAPSSFLSM